MTSVIAHRGASRVCRENTVDAFREAARIGADAVELDARRTGDDAIAVSHDAVLADGRVLCETKASDLPPDVASLGEALDACAGMWVNVELKNNPDDPDHDPGHRLAELVVAELTARGDDERWLLSSFDAATLDRCRKLAPQLRTAWLVLAADDPVVDRAVAAGHVALHPWVDTLTGAQIERCRDAGLAVNTWTCNDRERMSELIDAGVDGICTDVPDVLIDVLGTRAAKEAPR